MDPLRVDIWSDIACPWCWLGHAHLRKAADEAGVPVDVTFHAFQLAPDQKDVEPARDHLARKYGDAASIDAAQQRLVEMGSRLGLAYDFERSLAANTFDAHRLHQFAAAHGRGPETMRLLFQAQHAQGADVSDRGVLQQIGEDAGLSATDVEGVLTSDAYGDAVRADLAEARRIGVRGVPFFVLDRRLALSGAQPVEVFVDALRQAHPAVRS